MSTAKYSTDRLLNTQEAARYLRVSQASIRRWSDSGLLASHRVGRRRERRFREADLLVFMERSSANEPAPLAVNVAGVSVPVPGHLSPFFSSDEGGLRLTVPFLADGLRRGQPCFLVASGQVLDRYLEALDKESAVDVAAAVKAGLLTVAHFKGSTVAACIAQWEAYFAVHLAKGPTIIRVVGEMACEREMFTSEDEMLRYEEAFEVMSRRYPVAAVCQYDARAFDGVALLRALKTHPDMYAFRVGNFLN
ncbi:MAG TPA: MEDS domain-containing protein [Candidatus Udaeobacter sp.]|nr:MEDS domain-containing protein [Candidatus Udaeobacter sp.]